MKRENTTAPPTSGEQKHREAVGRVNSIPVGMPLEKQPLLQPSSSPEDRGCSGDARGHTMPRHMLSVPRWTRHCPTLHHPSSQHTRSSGPAHRAQAGPLLDPHCRNSIPHMGNGTDAAQETKLLFMARVCAEPAPTDPGQLHGAKTPHSLHYCVSGQRETSYYSHSEKQLTKITIFEDACY